MQCYIGMFYIHAIANDFTKNPKIYNFGPFRSEEVAREFFRRYRNCHTLGEDPNTLRPQYYWNVTAEIKRIEDPSMELRFWDPLPAEFFQGF